MVFVTFTPRAADPKLFYYADSGEQGESSAVTVQFVTKFKSESEAGPSPPQSAATLVALIQQHWHKREVSVRIARVVRRVR